MTAAFERGDERVGRIHCATKGNSLLTIVPELAHLRQRGIRPSAPKACDEHLIPSWNGDSVVNHGETVWLSWR
jgi:hypothetical protein